jgi:hypothetical protein
MGTLCLASLTAGVYFAALKADRDRLHTHSPAVRPLAGLNPEKRRFYTKNGVIYPIKTQPLILNSTCNSATKPAETTSALP